jgi:cell division protease FtsH
MALGATQQLPTNERHLFERGYLLDTLAVRMAGRVAEELTCDDISTGAANDLVEATQMASQMVRQWGMADRVAPMAWSQDRPVFLGTDLVQGREYSDATAHLLDTEVERILTEHHERTRRIMSDHLDALEAVAGALIEHETIDGATVAQLVDAHPPDVGDVTPGALVAFGQ